MTIEVRHQPPSLQYDICNTAPHLGARYWRCASETCAAYIPGRLSNTLSMEPTSSTGVHDSATKMRIAAKKGASTIFRDHSHRYHADVVKILREHVKEDMPDHLRSDAMLDDDVFDWWEDEMDAGATPSVQCAVVGVSGRS
jgi:hypothetical protein